MHALLAGSLGIQVFFGCYGLIANPLYDSPTFTAYFLAVAAISALDPVSMESPVNIGIEKVNK
jgi:hypothetical protein